MCPQKQTAYKSTNINMHERIMKIHRSEQEQMHMMMHDAYKAKCIMHAIETEARQQRQQKCEKLF